MNATHAQLLKKFHTLCAVQRISLENKRQLIASYGYESSRELTYAELSQLCSQLSQTTADVELDTLRKRALASVGGYLTLTNATNKDLRTIKAICCRSAEFESFNKIPAERLRNLYNTFLNKQKDFKAIQASTQASTPTPTPTREHAPLLKETKTNININIYQLPHADPTTKPN